MVGLVRRKLGGVRLVQGRLGVVLEVEGGHIAVCGRERLYLGFVQAMILHLLHMENLFSVH
jgi:hypothetical protein